VVPIVIDSKGVISEFFLVPYLGACIHVPPPPPNQLVYVKLSRGGVRIESLDEPFWVTGTLHTASSGTKLVTASYTLDATRMERYTYCRIGQRHATRADRRCRRRRWTACHRYSITFRVSRFP
jgi:hypothetical protein